MTDIAIGEDPALDVTRFFDAKVTLVGPGPAAGKKIAIGVAAEGTNVRWCADFTAGAETSLVDELPGDADATLIIGVSDALALLRDEPIAADALVEVVGDTELLAAFVAHCLTTTNAVQMRCTTPPRRRRRRYGVT